MPESLGLKAGWVGPEERVDEGAGGWGAASFTHAQPHPGSSTALRADRLPSTAVSSHYTGLGAKGEVWGRVFCKGALGTNHSEEVRK